MELKSIGNNIRKYRMINRIRQEDLAEKTGLSINYIGMIERGEKAPSLHTFINIANALSVSSDMILMDNLKTGYQIKSSILSEKLETLSPQQQKQIYEVMDAMIKSFESN